MAQKAPDKPLDLYAGALSGNLLFSPDGSYTIGALTGTRPSALYLGSSDLSVSGMVLEVANASGPSGGGAINFQKARGSLASKLAISNNDQLGNVNFYGYDGSAYGRGAAIVPLASEDWTTSHHGAGLGFRTAPNGTTSTALVWTITNGGHWSAGTDNTYDIGVDGARPRTLYLGTGINFYKSGGTNSQLTAPAAGAFYFGNDAGTDVNTNSIGVGTAASTGAKFRWISSGRLELDNGDASNYGDITLGRLSVQNSGGIVMTNGNITTPSAAVFSLLNAAGNANADLQVGPSALTAGTMTVTSNALARDAVTRFDWTNAMVTALGASTTGDITVATLPAKTVLLNAYVVITSPDTSSNALTVAVGRTSASYIDYIVANDAKAAANTVYGDASGERGTNLTGYDLPSFTGTTAVKAHFVKTTTNLSTVLGSTGTVYLETYTLP